MTSIDFHFHHMRRILAAVLMVLAVLGMPGSAVAQTEIDITGGRVDPLPIAIAPFLAGWLAPLLRWFDLKVFWHCRSPSLGQE